MSRHRLWPAFAGLALLLSHTSLAAAAAVHWNTADNNALWSNPNNWLPVGVPTATDTAVVDFPGTYTINMDVNPTIAALRISGSANGDQTVSGSNRTLTLPNPSSIGAQGVLSLFSCTVNGAGQLTNNGTLVASGPNSQVNGPFANASGAVLRVLRTSGTSAVLTVADGFTNNGSIELTSTSGAGTATLTVTAGTLVNAVTGTISVLAGTGGQRNLNAQLDNQGTIIVEAQNLTTNVASADHVNSGTINLTTGTTGTYTIMLSGTTPSFTTTGAINVPSGRTLTLQGVAGGGTENFHYNGGTMGGAGTVSLSDLTLNLGIPSVLSATLLDVNSSMVAGQSLTISSGRTVNLDRSTLSAPTTMQAGGTLVATGPSFVTGAFANTSGAVLRVSGVSGTSAELTLANEFTNNGSIELTSTGPTQATLTVTAGTLVNAVTGTISALPGSGGNRFLNAQLDNDGTISINATTTIGGSLTNSPGAVLSGSGTLTMATGSPFSQLGIVRPGTSPGALRFNTGLPSVSTSVYDIEIGGDNPGSGYDQLNVRDPATLAGTLNISVVNGYQPVPGRRYVVATFPSRTGTFGTVTGLDYGFEGQKWIVTYSDTDVVLLAMDQTWSRAFPDGAPPDAREGHTAVYDSTGDRMIVFGGRTDSGPQNDVWVLTKAVGFNYPAWVKLTPSGTPPAQRTNASAVYDPASNRLIVFGGDDGAGTPGVFGDTWVLTNANGLGGTPAWVALSPTGGPPAARSAHAAAYDPLHNRMMVIGGDTAPGSCGGALADAWVLQHASGLGGTPAWSALSPTGTPPSARSHHGAEYDAATGRLIVVGGDACAVPNMEVWHLERANGLGGTPAWMLVSPAEPAPATWSLGRYAYDRTLQWLDGFGGEVNGVLANTAYTLTGADGGAGTSWHRRLFYGTPPDPRSFHSMVMANASHTAVVFGGLKDSGRTNEVWRRQVDKGPVLDAEPPSTVAPTRTAFATLPSPNPAVGQVVMALDIARDQRVALGVFDVNGRQVATLHSGLLTAGRHTFRWGGAGPSARRAPPGVYLIRMHAEDRVELARVVQLD